MWLFFGHVDSGKSTTIGRLLLDTNTVQLKARGASKINYAWIVDELEEERSRGITMDVVTRTIQLDDGIVLNIIDTPGHMDYLSNLIKGLCQADVAVYIVDSSVGSFEASLGKSAPSKPNQQHFKPYTLNESTLSTHIMLAKSFGVANIIVLLNKMDLVEYNQQRFESIAATLRKCLSKYQYQERTYEIIPVSSVNGVNVIDAATNIPTQLSDWYSGRCLVESLKYHHNLVQSKLADDNLNHKTLFISVTDFYAEKSVYITICGKVLQGILFVNSKLTVAPANQVVTVKEIFRNNEKKSSVEAFANDMVTLNVINGDIDQIRRGDVITLADNPTTIGSSKIQSSIITTDLTKPITLGMHLLFHACNITTNVAVTRLMEETLRGGVVKNPLFVSENTLAKVEITFENLSCVQPFTVCKSLGRFCLMSHHGIVAVGIVDRVL